MRLMFDNFLDLTWRNPIFMMVAIGAVWFIPGIITRRIAENRYKAYKAKSQAEKIARLYPDNNHE